MVHTAIKPTGTNLALDDPGTGSLSPVAGSSSKAAGERAGWQNRIVAHAEVDPAELVANPLNWRLHPRAQQQAITAVLGDIGWVDDVIVNRTSGHILDGHLRVELALARHESTVPVKFVELTSEEEREVLATFDPIGAMALADREKLDSLLHELVPADPSIEALIEDLAKANHIDLRSPGLTDPDEAPPQPAESDLYVQPGELWLLGEHRLLVGDSTKPEDVARLFGGETATLMATDPPYLVDYDGGSHPQSWHNKAAVKDKHWDDYQDPEAGEAFFRAFIEAALPHLAPHVAIYQWHAHRRQALVEAAWTACGLLVHQQLIWSKARAVLTHSHYMWQHEPCFYGWVEGAPPLLKPPANATTIWQVDQVGESDGIHPTQKPTELFARPIAYHTHPGEICYDAFLGSGTASSRPSRRADVATALRSVLLMGKSASSAGNPLRARRRSRQMADHSSAVSTPARRRPPWQPRFLEIFAATGNVRLAASASGVSRDAPYKRAQADAAFAAAWLRAREDAVDMLEAEARRRALSTSDALLMFLLRSERPEKFREKVDVRLDLRREAERIATSLNVDVEAMIAMAERLLAEGGAA